VDMKKARFPEICETGLAYSHVLGCEDCFDRFADAYEEYGCGNTSFSYRDFHANLTLLEVLLKKF